ncbi:MAG: FAD-binding oxidoreductase [Pseudomonadota bacterium]
MEEAVYWWEGQGAPEAGSEELPPKVDLLIIGAGYTGLSAAIAAHDAGASVAVADAGAPGIGASTRNGGMFGAHPRLPYDRLKTLFGEAVARGVMAEATIALDFVRDLQVREGINCDYQNTGRISLAWTRKDFEAQKRMVGRLAEMTDVDAYVVEKADLRDEVGTDLYHGGLVLPQHGAINPRKFHDGLMAAATRRGVPVVGDCEVTALTRSGGGWRADTPRGHVEAEKVILATNGYTGGLVPHADRRVFPLPSFIIATEKLSPNLLRTLAPKGRMMVETRARHSYFRLSPDGTRILWGGRAAMTPKSLKTVSKRLRATMEEVWPESKGVDLTHVWTGNTGYSFTHMPQVGEAEGVHFALAMSGSGTVMAPYLGAKAAWRALGDPRGETAYAGTTLSTSPLYFGGYPYFLEAAELWYRMVVDRAQNIRAKL